jgi:diacylglycerol kinase family enzyme
VDATCTALRSLDPGVVPVAAGGDGTAGLLATALDRNGAGAVMALLPLGTGNILARALGVGEPGQAFRALEQGAVRHIDVMRTSHPAAPLALVSISAGFEGRFLHRYAACRFLGRPLAALTALLGSLGQGASIGLELDGQAVIRPGDVPFTAGLYNTSLYAGGLVMLPGADPADGAGEGAVYQTAWAYGVALGAALRRVAPRPRADVLHRRWRTAWIDCPGPLQIDGEPVAAREVSVWLEPRALTIVAPAREGPGAGPS